MVSRPSKVITGVTNPHSQIPLSCPENSSSSTFILIKVLAGNRWPVLLHNLGICQRYEKGVGK